jgi:hypothetical protein
MKKKATIIKTLFTLLLVIVTVFGASINVIAVMPESKIVHPRWTSISNVNLDLTFDGVEGNATGSAGKQSTATSIEGTLIVYKQVGNDWEYVGEGYAAKRVGTLIVSVDFIAEYDVTYKAVFTVTAYTGTAPETEIIEYIKTC